MAIDESLPELALSVSEREAVIERFMAKVTVSSDCWLWKTRVAVRSNPYGYFSLRGKHRPAHRVSLWLFRGVPLGGGQSLHADHLCRTPLCVNPDHLEMVTPKENCRRAEPYRTVPRGSHQKGKPKFVSVACAHGHVWTDATTRWYSGRRVCRICHSATANRARNARVSAKPQPVARVACLRGHSLTPENIYQSSGGRKRCVACRKNHRLAYQHRQEMSMKTDTTPPIDWTPRPAPAHLIIQTDARDLREWERNEVGAPINERFTAEGRQS